MRTPKRLVGLVLTLSACGGGPKSDVVIVARQTLSQSRLLAYMAQTTSNASSYALADAIAEGWLDLALVSEAAAEGLTPEDTSLQRQALAPFVRTEYLRRLQNAVAMTRPPLTVGELDSAFNGDSLRLFQRILVRVPDWRDAPLVHSRRVRADSILALARAGAPFDQLAKRFSQDPSAQSGGYLGLVTRDHVDPSFRDRLWALEPGGVSPVLAVQQGFQIVRRPPLEEAHTQFAAQLLRYAGARADSTLADSLADARGMTILPATVARMRAVLTNPDSMAPDSAWIVAFDEGGVAPREAWLWLAALPDPVRFSLARASDAQVEAAARAVARNELLYRMAKARGIDVGVEDLGDVRGSFVAAADSIFAIFAAADAPRRQALVDSIVGSVLSGRPGPQLPAGLASALRRRIPHILDRRALGAVARRAPYESRTDSAATRGRAGPRA